MQERGVYQLFYGPVYPLIEEHGKFEPVKQPLAWWKNLLGEVPLSAAALLSMEGDCSVFPNFKSGKVDGAGPAYLLFQQPGGEQKH
jgi:hypothetical protein